MIGFLFFVLGLAAVLSTGTLLVLKPAKISTFLLLPFGLVLATAFLGAPSVYEFGGILSRVVIQNEKGVYELTEMTWCPHSCVNVPTNIQEYNFFLHNNQVRVRYFVDLEIADPIAMIKALGINPAGGKIVKSDEVKDALWKRLGPLFDGFAKTNRKVLLEVEPGNIGVKVFTTRKIMEASIGQELRRYGLKIKQAAYTSGTSSTNFLRRRA